MVLKNLKLIMMVNLSECKFGDKLKTRDGRMALFLQRSNVVKYAFSCAIESGSAICMPLYYIHGRRCFHSEHEHTELDIVGKWEDEGEYIGQQEINIANKEECINGKSE